MRIALFIVTYKNEDLLARCLNSVFDAGENPKPDADDSLRVCVLNNHGELKHADLQLTAGCTDYTIINNAGRPSFSTGHLARSWNQGILHGFVDPRAPAADLLILAQNDVVFKPDFLSHAKAHARTFDYVTAGRGDEVQLLTPDAVRAVGLFDERFCNIGYQEADYFVRAMISLRDKASINDAFHGRVHNPIDPATIIEDVPSGYLRNDAEHACSSAHHQLSRTMFVQKWRGILPFRRGLGANDYPAEAWDDRVRRTAACAKQFVMYPYFESHLPDLERKYVNYSPCNIAGSARSSQASTR